MSTLDDQPMLDPHVSMDMSYMQKQISFDDEDDEEVIDESQDTVTDIDDLNRRLGDTLLENIHLKHEKRQSIAMAERWKTQAEKLQKKIAKTQDKLSVLSQQGVIVSVDEEDDGDMDDIYDTEREKLKEKIAELSKQVESLQLEYGDEVLTNIKLRREKRESVMLLEREKGEKESLKRVLSSKDDAISQLTQSSLNNRLTQEENDNDEMSMEEMSRVELQLAHRQSLIQIASYRQQAEALQKELEHVKRTGPEQQQPQEPDVQDEDSEMEEKVRDLNLQLGDEVLANIRLKREKRQSLMVAKTYQTQLNELQNEIVQLKSENRRLETSKMQSLTNLTTALNDSREIISKLSKRLERYE